MCVYFFCYLFYFGIGKNPSFKSLIKLMKYLYAVVNFCHFMFSWWQERKARNRETHQRDDGRPIRVNVRICHFYIATDSAKQARFRGILLMHLFRLKFPYSSRFFPYVCVLFFLFIFYWHLPSGLSAHIVFQNKHVRVK